MIDPAPFSPRHIEVLEAALALIAERGIAGASLRELARRLGLSQPSLYHYFASKDELIEQIVTLCGANMTAPPTFDLPPELFGDLELIPALVSRMVFDLYERDQRHTHFVRFMFAVATERPDQRARLRRFFREQITASIDLVMSPWVARGELTTEEARNLAFMISRALGLAMIEHHILADQPDREELIGYARFVVEAAVHTVRARRPVALAALADLDTPPAPPPPPHEPDGD